MYYEMNNNKLEPIKNFRDHKYNPDCAYIAIVSPENLEQAAEEFELDKSLIQEGVHSKAAKFESLDGFDFVCFNILDYKNLHKPQKRLLLYLKKNIAVLITEEEKKIENWLKECAENKNIVPTFHRMIYDLVNRISTGDAAVFENLEKEIMNLEDALISSKKRDCVKEIVSLRKRLMILKRYYGQLLDLLDDIQENENDFFDPQILRYFHVLENRVNRIYNNVLNLQDHVTQVREAYQAEVDIDLNTTMKIFTVITTIFLPLTLIAGWYGMNLKMPEYDWPYSYGMVIVVSIIVVVVSILFFKRKKWF